jgi:hypothetical protein
MHPLEYKSLSGPSSLEEGVEEEAYLERGAELFERDEFSEWALLTPAAFDHADEMSLLQKDGCGKSTLREKRVLESFCRETVLPVKEELRSRLLLMANFLSKRPDSEEALRICLATAEKIGKCHDEELSTVPFIWQLAKESISRSLKALDEGFDLRDFTGELDETDL